MAYFGFGPAASILRTPTQYTKAQQPAITPAEKPPEKKHKRTERNRAALVPARAEAEEAEENATAPAVPSLIVDVPILAPPFPLSRDIGRGTSRANLRSEFGPPQLRVSATSRGQFMEKYVYIKPDRSAITIAYLENGAVVSAESIPQ